MALSGWLFAASLLQALCRVLAEDARIAPIPDPPEWQLASLLHLQLAAPESEALHLTYNVYPLTEDAGLNQTDRSSIWIRGSLVAAEDPDNADALANQDTIAFLCCDNDNATAVVNRLMEDAPRAILLYSIHGNSCSLDGDDLSYNTIYTMGDSDEAADTVNNTIRAGGTLRATITGSLNATNTPSSTQEQQNGSNSAIAMSVLYSITGLITVLFLIIIVSGAVRAHRYPERYGPRSGYGGRPPQSRAKGLARAVLETLPIVRFGDPAKGDRSFELESQRSATAQDPTLGTRLSAIPEEPRTPQDRKSDVASMSGAAPQPEVTPAESQQSDADAVGRERHKAEGRPSDEHVVCSICTEDFTVGEEVRLLPCSHQFHPPCIDPWLINISGTCPLCRLDLGTHSEQTAVADRDDPFLSAPPLAATENWNEHDDGTTTANNNNSSSSNNNNTAQQQRRRSSRFLDLHRLRHASVEERIEILRRHSSRHQAQRAAGGGGGNGELTEEEQRGRRARLADRLRERFHIRTTAPAATMTTTTTTATTGPPAEGGERS